MFAIVAGGGKVGSYLAGVLRADGHEVTVIDKRGEIVAMLPEEVDAKIFHGDACDPEQFEAAGVANADLVAALTGHDEDNLVICQLAKYTFGVPRTIARVNNPRNEWLYTKEWGVDVAVSAVHIVAKIIQEEASIGDIVTLFKLPQKEVALVETTIAEESKAAGNSIQSLTLPPDTVLVAVVRGDKVIIPKGETTLEADDKVLVVTKVEREIELAEALASCEVKKKA